MTIVTATFGPLYDGNERRRRGMHNVDGHADCSINDDWCGDANCVMAEHDGRPVHIERHGVTLSLVDEWLALRKSSGADHELVGWLLSMLERDAPHLIEQARDGMRRAAAEGQR